MKKLHLFKHSFLVLLAALLVAQSLSMTACGGETTETDAVETTATETTVETEPETAYIDTLPETDLEGYTYRMVAQHTDSRPNFASQEELTGEVLQDAIINRKNMTMERLNIKIEEIAYEDRGKLETDVSKTIRAGDDAYDIVITALSAGINNLARQQCLLDLTTVPYLTLDSVRWNASMAENMRIDGKQYFTTGVTSVCYLRTPQATLFNQQLANDLGLPNLYEIALDGKWTIDKMDELMTAAAMDLNGDGEMKPQDDQFAMIIEGTYGNALYMSAGLQAVSPDADGNWSFHLSDQASMDLIDKCAAIFFDPQTIHTDTDAIDQDLMAEMFQEGRGLFLSASIGGATSYREMEMDFGVLPIPVLKEGDPYLTACNTWLPSGIGIPVTNGNLETTGLVMETMAAFSYDQILPAIVEKTLGKTARDAESYQIMMMLYDNTAFDFNTIMNFGDTSNMLRSAMIGAKQNFASSYASVKAKADKALADFIAACRGE